MSAILEIHDKVLSLRQAKISDLPTICAIERLAHKHPWTLKALEPEFSHPWSRFRLAILRDPLGGDEEAVGYCLSWLLPGELHILNVAVLPDYRRLGIARKMMEDALRLARQADAAQIFLEVRISNEAAIALYRSFGFEQVGLRKKYYEKPVEDALVFVLSLDGESA
ncbi:MAG: ribosomal protein S18-alanine N-acetyltransferase [Myxococcales bacterium]|nr:ribosomal protein S18-alanine N-acetyltransferase [Myxococcales bacterium]